MSSEGLEIPDPQKDALFHMTGSAGNVAKHVNASAGSAVWTTSDRVLMEVHDTTGLILKRFS